ncbi:MAG: N-acetylneuraminate synthase family protein [Desulfobacula sp.]|jgi:sialic acid synthase SpsE/sugar phosphate isomerase/epimerase|nr:N-acetylneuraminate synthase family protein [Desulfobacula sp.]
MIIERNFSKYAVFTEDTLLNALNKISKNKERLIFVVSESGILEGALSDGDLRRWLISTSGINLQKPVYQIMNRDIRQAFVDARPEDINKLLDSKHLAIPLVDVNKRLIAVAFGRRAEIEIAGRVISEESPAFIIAEIGNNHNGSLERAKALIDEAIAAGADCAKFQMRSMAQLYKNHGSTTDDSADLGAQYTLELLSKFQLSDEYLFEAFDYCKEKGIIPLCTPWDKDSLAKLEAYGLQAYKLASADFTNYELMSALVKTRKPIICSTGMSSEREIIDGINKLKGFGSPFILLHCNSTYPAPFKDINLKYMMHLQKQSECLVGYSGHERDINVAIAAVSLGAKVIEKHFTLDQNMEGNDHKVSLLPDEFTKMVVAIRQVEEALGTVVERKITQGEMMNRETLAKSLVAARDIDAGAVIMEEMIMVRSPGQGLQPSQKNELIGRILPEAKKAGDFFFASDLDHTRTTQAKNYEFPHKWGIPVRYHDMKAMLSMSNMDILEIHLSYKDIELNFKDYIKKPLDKGLVVHSPELFEGDHTLDLCSLDEVYRKRSIAEFQRVIDLTRELSEYFNNTAPTCIVTNVGGFSHDGHIEKASFVELYKVLEGSFAELDMDGIEIIPQTMPPFPWHFGGQQFHNLFVDAESIIEFCQKNAMRICLDTSHSKLACNHGNWSFTDFVQKVAPYVAHMHLADATGVDGEGIQIADGEIDWSAFVALAADLMPKATFIPEIWQGHKNGGEGAWLALECLERIFKNL